MPQILRIAVPVPLDRLFDYLPPDGADLDKLEPGIRLLVPFGRHKKVGVLMNIAHQSDVDEVKLKKAQRVLDEKSLLGPRDLEMLRWASRYYHYPLGEVISAAFPVLLRR
ncbi:MAG: primosomal protein N', partial [Pseudomonadota bacterium]